MATFQEPAYPISKDCLQSDPIDLDKKYDAAWLKGKTVVITGGASGFGKGFCLRWAKGGANIVIGDINVEGGLEAVADIEKAVPGAKVLFVQCNVTDWKSQVNLFKQAAKFSPTGGIDMVVANAGVAGPDNFEDPAALSEDEPTEPNIRTVNVNLIGVLYTTHLALFWLQKNPNSKGCDPKSDPATNTRDRHLLLVGSMASLGPLPIQANYCAAKHGVLGLFRSLRTTAWIHGIRVNLLCPYFVDTPILPAGARLLLAGGGMGVPEDVVEAGTRFAADSSIVGRSLYVGPKVHVKVQKDGNIDLAEQGTPGGVTRAAWEPFANDLIDSELFGRRFIVILNAVSRMRGVTGWFRDVLKAVVYGFRNGLMKSGRK